MILQFLAVNYNSGKCFASSQYLEFQISIQFLNLYINRLLSKIPSLFIGMAITLQNHLS